MLQFRVCKVWSLLYCTSNSYSMWWCFHSTSISNANYLNRVRVFKVYLYKSLMSSLSFLIEEIREYLWFEHTWHQIRWIKHTILYVHVYLQLEQLFQLSAVKFWFCFTAIHDCLAKFMPFFFQPIGVQTKTIYALYAHIFLLLMLFTGIC